jgi:hypothetical protein
MLGVVGLCFVDLGSLGVASVGPLERIAAWRSPPGGWKARSQYSTCVFDSMA